jgi:hypothetical protein
VLVGLVYLLTAARILSESENPLLKLNATTLLDPEQPYNLSNYRHLSQRNEPLPRRTSIPSSRGSDSFRSTLVFPLCGRQWLWTLARLHFNPSNFARVLGSLVPYKHRTNFSGRSLRLCCTLNVVNDEFYGSDSRNKLDVHWLPAFGRLDRTAQPI